MPEAFHQVIVNHAGGLHERVTDGRSDKAEATLREVLAQGVRLRRASGHVFQAAPVVLAGAADDELPYVPLVRWGE
jgi:hypothetical protein